MAQWQPDNEVFQSPALHIAKPLGLICLVLLKPCEIVELLLNPSIKLFVDCTYLIILVLIQFQSSYENRNSFVVGEHTYIFDRLAFRTLDLFLVAHIYFHYEHPHP